MAVEHINFNKYCFIGCNKQQLIGRFIMSKFHFNVHLHQCDLCTKVHEWNSRKSQICSIQYMVLFQILSEKDEIRNRKHVFHSDFIPAHCVWHMFPLTENHPRLRLLVTLRIGGMLYFFMVSVMNRELWLVHVRISQKPNCVTRQISWPMECIWNDSKTFKLIELLEYYECLSICGGWKSVVPIDKACRN